MGIAKGIGWALGLYESDEHYQKRLNKWNKQQNESLRLSISNVLGSIELHGYQSAVDFLEWENSGEKVIPWPDIDLTIKKMWATKPEIIEKTSGLNYQQYYEKLEKKQKQKELAEQNKLYWAKDKELLDKEKEILELKIKLAELEKSR